MSRPLLGLALASVASGCRVVDAPANLEDLLVYGFTHFETDQAASEAAVEGLMPLTLAREAELEGGYRVSSLTVDDIRAAGVEPPVDISITGAAVTVRMRSDVHQLAQVLTWPDMTEVQEAMLAWTVESETDRDCFLEGSCPSYRVEGVRERDVGILGTATQRFVRAWIWVEVDDTRVLVQRELLPEPAEITTAIYQVNQQYSYSVLFPHEGGTQRIEAYWVDAEAIGVDLPDAFALDLAVGAVVSNAENLDAFVDQAL